MYYNTFNKHKNLSHPHVHTFKEAIIVPQTIKYNDNAFIFYTCTRESKHAIVYNAVGRTL